MDTALGTTSKGESATLSIEDRMKHVYTVGKTGQGKSVLLENMMMDDLAAGRGFAFFDPHGESADRILAAVPRDRAGDVIFFDASTSQNVHYNPLQCPPNQAPLVAEQLITTTKNLWPDMWGPNLEYIYLNTLLLLMHTRGTTLIDAKRVLVDRDFREQLIRTCTDPEVRSVWRDEFSPRANAKKDTDWRREIQSTLNKVGRFASIPVLRNVLGRPSTIHPADIMRQQKVLIAKLPLGKIGRTPARLIGAFLASGFIQAAEGRAPDAQPFTLYFDEFQNFVTETFDTTLAESRKWRLALVMAHQYAGQLPDGLLDAVLGNAGSIVCFHVGAKTAQLLASELGTTPQQITGLPKYSAYAKLPEHDARWLRTFAPKAAPTKAKDRVLRNTNARYVRGKRREPPAQDARSHW